MYAIIESGGKQYRVEKGRSIQVEKLMTTVSTAITFDKVVAIVTDQGSKIGSPYVTGAAVRAERQGDGKSDKITIFKYKRRKKYRKTQGHRQPFTEVTITDIIG